MWPPCPWACHVSPLSSSSSLSLQSELLEKDVQPSSKKYLRGVWKIPGLFLLPVSVVCAPNSKNSDY